MYFRVQMGYLPVFVKASNKKQALQKVTKLFGFKNPLAKRCTKEIYEIAEAYNKELQEKANKCGVVFNPTAGW